MKYYVMANCSREGREYDAVVDEFPDDYPLDSWEFFEGDRMIPQMDEPLELGFAKDHPEGRKLIDLQHTRLGFKIVSPRFRELLEGEGEVEFIPVKLLDHRGNEASGEYAIANVLDALECLDNEKSDVIMNDLDPDSIFRIKRMVLKDSVIPEDICIFTIKQCMTTIIVKEPLKEKIEAAGMDGPLFVPVEEFDSALYLGV